MKVRNATILRYMFVGLAVVALAAGALALKAPDPDALAMATMIPRPSPPTPAAPKAPEPFSAQVAMPNVDAACAEATRAKEKSFTVLACGDILLARTPGKRAAQYGFRYLFKDIKDIVSTADIAFANLETPASYLGAPYPGKPENVTFRADPATLFGIAWAGFDVVSLANNHINDYGPRAVEETLDYLKLLGIQSGGVGRSIEEARKPAIVIRDGVSFAFLAYAVPAYSIIGATGSLSGAALTRAEERLHGPIPPLPPATNPDSSRNRGTGVALATRENIIADIQHVKASLAPDYLFVSVHWGEEHQRIPDTVQRILGRAAIDAGATAVLGHHPHVLQSLERYHGGLIIYSLGNFIFDMAATTTYETAALSLVLAGGRLIRADILPLRIERDSYAPALVIGADAIARLNDLARWSARFETDILVEGSIGHLYF
ncbi:MAG: hypothetical protein A2Y38_03535 [Spirochaetes bacterium GWB1_59_5]|nr:MAG: hypothetical protein A2Y38_03535 [Spirochaetes bacterium GWB1_59_5]